MATEEGSEGQGEEHYRGRGKKLNHGGRGRGDEVSVCSIPPGSYYEDGLPIRGFLAWPTKALVLLLVSIVYSGVQSRSDFRRRNSNLIN